MDDFYTTGDAKRFVSRYTVIGWILTGFALMGLLWLIIVFGQAQEELKKLGGSLTATNRFEMFFVVFLYAVSAAVSISVFFGLGYCRKQQILLKLELSTTKKILLMYIKKMRKEFAPDLGNSAIYQEIEAFLGQKAETLPY